jgi:probable rRNA maturation factor
LKIIDVSSDDAEPPDWLPGIPRLARETLRAARIKDYELSVLLCDDRRIAELNATYRGISEPTDVLSFSQADGDDVPGDDALRGDVVVSLDTVRRNALSLGIPPAEEFIRVIVHGVLHLAGYEHDGTGLSDEAARTHPMFALQERVVTQLIKEQNH